MTLKINTNISALTAHKNMVINDEQMQKSINRLTTGKRINSAADDTSGLAIADSLLSTQLALGQAQRNISDARSVLEVADGALEEAVSIVNSIRQKAIQSAQDGQSLTTRRTLQNDVARLLEELDMIARTTNFNGKKLLSGSFINKQFQVGATSGETVKLTIDSAEPTVLGHVNASSISLSENGGRVRLGVFSSIKGTTFYLDEVNVGFYNDPEKSVQALVNVINRASDDIDITAYADVTTTSSGLIVAGETEDDFAINGIPIGKVIVNQYDQGNNLIDAINQKTTSTGVKASKNTAGNLILTSTDGRPIQLSGTSITNKSNDGINKILSQNAASMSTIGKITIYQRGAARVVLDNIGCGNVVNSNGIGYELNTSTNLTYDSTLASKSVIVGGSILQAGWTINQSLTGLDTLAPTSFGATNKTTLDSTIKKGSTLPSGTVYAANSIVGASTPIGAVTSITSGVLEANTSLANGTVLRANTNFPRDITLTGNLTDAVGGTLKAGSSLSASTQLNLSSKLSSGVRITLQRQTAPTTETITITGDGNTSIGDLISANLPTGVTLTDYKHTINTNNVVLGASVTLTGSQTIQYTGNSILQLGSTIGIDSTLGVDYTLGATYTLTKRYTIAGSINLAAGTTLATGSYINQEATQSAATVPAQLEADATLKAGSAFIALGTTFASGSTIGRIMTIANDQALTIASGSSLKVLSGSTLANLNGAATPVRAIIANGSDLGGTIKLQDDETIGTGNVNVAVGSVLFKDTKIVKGAFLTNDFKDSDGTVYKSGTRLSKDITIAENTTINADQTLPAGSVIKALSTLAAVQNKGQYATTTLGSEKVTRLSDVSVLTFDGAQMTIAVAEAAVISLDKVRAEIGSAQQQLQVTEANVATSTINLASAESTIRDVDFAAESSNLTRLKILSQSGAYALAQANTSAETVLRLLQD